MESIFFEEKTYFFDSNRAKKRNFFTFDGFTMQEEAQPSAQLRAAADALFLPWHQKTLFDMRAPSYDSAAYISRALFSIWANKREIGDAVLRPDAEIDTAIPQNWADAARQMGIDTTFFGWCYLKDGSEGPVNILEQAARYLMYHRDFFRIKRITE